MDILVGWAEILSAVGTVGALFFIANQTKQANRALEHTREMLSIEQSREVRVLAEEAQQQASGVVCWPAKLIADDGTVAEWGLEVVNTSPGPVFSWSISRGWGETKKGGKIVPVSGRAALVAPGRYFMPPGNEGKYLRRLAEDAVTEPILGNSGYSAAMTFTDSNGKTWTRDARGSLASV
ncbi:hypothetical protein ACQ7FX_02495 [Arthrobacter koreensis]|uniref:hypothetical protein n=1 Tax=Arthrobacter koreensis TaxID=199136 RepID=UPI003D8FF2D0